MRTFAPVEPRPVIRGSHVRVAHDPSLRPADGLVVSTWVWLSPRAPAGRRRALLATWGDGDGYALAIDPDGRPCFEVGRGGARERGPRRARGRTGDLGPPRGGARPAHRDALADPLAPRLAPAGGGRRGAATLRARRPRGGPGRPAAGRRATRRGPARRPPRRQARLARDPLGTRRRANGRRLGPGRGARAPGDRLGPAQPPWPLRQRPAAGGHRRGLARRRPRLAAGAGAVRGDALPRRRGRRPRLGAELRARAAATRCEAAPTRSSWRPAAPSTGSASSSAGPPAPRRRPTQCCCRPSPTWPTRASSPPRGSPARSAPRTAGSPSAGCAASTTATTTAAGSTRRRSGGR